MKISFEHRSVMTKILSLALALALLVCGMGISAHAETMTADLITLDSTMNLSIAVTFTDDGTGAVPQLSFISPTGEVYQQGLTAAEKLTVQQSGNTIYYLIPDAPGGNWKIVYDSAFAGRLAVTTAPYARDLIVEQFSVVEMRGDYAAVSFLASFPAARSYNYVISAVTTDAGGAVTGTKELYTGFANANEAVNTYVPLYDLASYDDYRLQLEVYLDDYGVETGDTALTDPFAYENSNMPGMIGEFRVILNRSTGDMEIDWSEAAVYNADNYILAVFSSLDESEPVYTNTFTSDVTATSILVDPTADWLRVELSYTYTNMSSVSQTRSVTINPNEVKFGIVTDENTSSLQAEVSYEVPSGEVELYVFLSEEEEPQPIKVSGSGTLAVNIGEFDNTVYVAYKPTDYVVIMESKDIYSDRKAPILTFFEDLSSVTTTESLFRVAGMTEAGASVTVNGTAVTINADGSFLIELNLMNGANSFEIVSADPAGNQSRRTVIINRSETVTVVDSEDVQPFWKTWMPLIISIAASLALVILILALFGGKKKLTAVQTLKRWSILGWVLSGVGLGVTVWLLVEKVIASNAVNTTTFFDLVQASIDEAYAALTDLQFFGQWFMVALIVTAVLIVLSIGLTVAAVIVGKNQNKPPKPPKEPKKPKQPKTPKTAEPTPTVAPEPTTEPEPAPIVAPEPTPEPEPAPAVVPEHTPEPEPAPAVIPEPTPEPEPAPVVAPEPTPEPEPAPAVIPEPTPEPEPTPAVVPEPTPETAPIPKPATPRFCPNCGSRCVEGAAFCANCGHKLK